MSRLVRLSTSRARKEERLSALMADCVYSEPELEHAVEDAQILGSLELAGCAVTPEDLAGARSGETAGPAGDLLRALRAVPPESPFCVAALEAWQEAVTGSARLRSEPRSRADAPAPAPPAFIGERLASLEHWLQAGSARELTAEAAGALVLARLVEILPFDDANGRLSRLAASHVMRRAGARPPILRGSDGPRLVSALKAAFQLETEPLVRLLAEASERSLDVMLHHLGGGAAGRVR
jgi:hypothetical protein